MRINQGELAELLNGEIMKVGCRFNDAVGSMQITLHWVTCPHEIHECATLEHLEFGVGGQMYYIVQSTSPDMIPGCTISVDEILDIVL